MHRPQLPAQGRVLPGGGLEVLQRAGHLVGDLAREQAAPAARLRRALAGEPVHQRAQQGRLARRERPARAGAPITPVRTSPAPPRARASSPRGLTCSVPSGVAMSVGEPLSRRTTSQRAASSGASAKRRATTSRASRPASRASSPGCGVSTTRSLAKAGSTPSRAKALRASASTTTGTVALAQQVDHQAVGVGVVAEAGTEGERVLAREQVVEDGGRPSGAMVSRSVIGSARTMASGRPMRSDVSRQPGTAMVSRPTPARSAPRPARCAAPP